MGTPTLIALIIMISVGIAFFLRYRLTKDAAMESYGIWYGFSGACFWCAAILFGAHFVDYVF